jgi:hypothetical protein
MYVMINVVNFIVSGNAVEWYFRANNNNTTQCGRPFKRLISKNWGSVAGGSFLNAFFNIFDVIYDFFRVFFILFSVVPTESVLATTRVFAAVATIYFSSSAVTSTRISI